MGSYTKNSSNAEIRCNNQFITITLSFRQFKQADNINGIK